MVTGADVRFQVEVEQLNVLDGYVGAVRGTK